MAFFELIIAKKYLVPRKKQLSMSLIAIMSVFVISLVVWLLLLFLSVTDGIEKNWLGKLTSLNAPVKIVPTNKYYSSYYYQIDSISEKSNYTHKTISEKLISDSFDPYDPEMDMELPSHFPTKTIDRDLIKTVFGSVNSLKSNYPSILASDYEISGALMKLQVQPKYGNPYFVTQVTYVNSLSENSSYLFDLVEKPAIEDLNQILYLATLHTYDEETLTSLFTHLNLKQVSVNRANLTKLLSQLPNGTKIAVTPNYVDGTITYFTATSALNNLKTSIITLDNGFYFDEKTYNNTPIFLNESIFIEKMGKVDVDQGLLLDAEIRIQGKTFTVNLPLQDIEISRANIITSFEKDPDISPLWAYEVKDTNYQIPSKNGLPGVILPKNYIKNGMRIGDIGYFSYGSANVSSYQEQKLNFYIAGFYDPGVMAIGAKCVLASKELTHHLNTASSSPMLDSTLTSGIHVWFPSIKDAKQVKQKLQTLFEEQGISEYFTVSSFYEYDFAKDLIQQFQSDKYLFTMIGAIILLVACSNIISLLVLLVTNKKKEIGVLRSMGASTKSIAIIFALCGVIMGVLSTVIGTTCAYLTLKNIDSIAQFLSYLQGHNAFNEAFYGKQLPSELSKSALIFIISATPVLSLLAGLIPAIKAAKIKPSITLKGG